MVGCAESGGGWRSLGFGLRRGLWLGAPVSSGVPFQCSASGSGEMCRVWARVTKQAPADTEGAAGRCAAEISASAGFMSRAGLGHSQAWAVVVPAVRGGALVVASIHLYGGL